jgi:hypothetical protein
LLIWRGLATLALGAALAVLAGALAAAEEPSVAITSPADGSVLDGPDIVVEIAVSGFTMRPPLEPVREPNTGYVIYFLDIAPAFDQPTPLGEDAIIHSGRLSETFFAAAAGQHTLYVCLAYDDHTCVDAALTDAVQISVGQPPPTEEPTAEPTPEPTLEPTPEPKQEPPLETPTPTVTPEPTPEPPAETPTVSGTPAPSPTPTPTTPNPTPRPLQPTPISPTETPKAGQAPGTMDDDSGGGNFVWLYAVVGGVAAMVVVGCCLLWPIHKLRSRR